MYVTRTISRATARQVARYAITIRQSSSTPSQTVILRSVDTHHNGHIKILSLNQPRARNAISRQLLHDLSSHIEALHSEPVTNSTRALILASESDSSFCAGADLKERLTFTPAETSSFLSDLRNTFSRIEALRIPTIAAVASTALGGGLELALCTHLRVFARDAIVGLPETRLAIIPGAGGTYRLPALIGTTHARDLILTGRKLDGAEAYRLGLCDRVVDTPDTTNVPGMAMSARQMTLDAAVELAHTIAKGGPIAIRAALAAVNGAIRGQNAENEAYEMVLGTKDRLEALRAFAEKREPLFRGA